VPHVALVTAEGDALGAMELGPPDWPIGSVISMGSSKPNQRVVDHLPADDTEHEFASLVVEPVGS
jgi:hypothetical protein